MKILWIVNTIFPYPAMQLGKKNTVFGGWLNSLAEQLKTEIELAIATVYDGDNIKQFYDENIMYYLIPGAPAVKYNKKMEKYWKEVNDNFKPDIVHIHGTEFAHGLAFQEACPSVKTVVSIQGLVSQIAKVYYANISICEIIKNITFRDIIRFDSIINARKKFEQRGKNEIEIIKLANAIIGRTTWDYANTKAINPKAKYYKLNETLREPFYNHLWKYDNIEKHSIFCSQAGYPIKGLHYMLEALYILKRKYPDVKLYVAGTDITHKRLKTSGYGQIISNRIKKYNLEDNVIFTGILNENEMVERLLKTNVFVSPSAIENSSNSLCEAMILGVPCVASNTGGTMDMIEHNKEGFLYPYTEPAVCAEYISKIFENNEIALECGKNARNRALKRHDKNENRNKTIQIYKEMIEGRERGQK